jgi:hypothetical protein
MKNIGSRARSLPGPATILFLTAVAGCGKGPPPAEIPNASFEVPDPERPAERPADWRPYRWRGRGEFGYAETGRAGGRSVTIASSEGGDLSWAR